MALKITKQNQQLETIAKNSEINKKTRLNVEKELETIAQKCQLQKHGTYA
jgi:hypothetical protein